MAILTTRTFPNDTSGQRLLQSVKQALTHLTGVKAPAPHGNGAGGHQRIETPVDLEYQAAPFRLDPDRDELRSDYRLVWRQCSVAYDPTEPGAEVGPDDRTLCLGPFCLTLSVPDVEKIILHEYLHLVVEGWGSGDSQHPQINLIIKCNLGYLGSPNPANPADDFDCS